MPFEVTGADSHVPRLPGLAGESAGRRAVEDADIGVTHVRGGLCLTPWVRWRIKPPLPSKTALSQNMQNLRSILLTGLCLFYGATTSASAAVTVFNFTYSGVAEGNNAVATGQITLDTALLGSTAPFSSVVSGLSLTVSGATFAADNGTFGLADYNHIIWGTGGVSLDFNSELVGQGGWGPIGNVGDFGLTTSTIGFNARAASKDGSGSFRLRAGGDRNKSGDRMRLTSFAPAAVPEPSRALLGALGVLGLVLRRRRSC